MLLRYYKNSPEFRHYLALMGLAYWAEQNFGSADLIGISWDAPAKFKVVRTEEKPEPEES